MINFNDPSVFETIPNVPVLDEHELTGADGEREGYVDRRVLEQIAANNNRRVAETGDPAPLIIGHTSDDPKAPEKPVIGYAVNYRVRPFNRNPDGSTKYAIFTDFKVYHEHAQDAKRYYPRRSIELWLSKREIDPIALLGGTTPERDLGVVVRNSRLKAVALLGGTAPARDLGVSLHYSRRSGSVLRYAMEDDTPHPPKGVVNPFPGKNIHNDLIIKALAGMTAESVREQDERRAARRAQGLPEDDPNEPDPFGDYPEQYAMEDDDMPCPPGKMNYAAEPGDGPDDLDDDLDDTGGDDTVVAKVLASKPFKDMQSKIDQMFDAIMGEAGGEGGDPGMGDGMDDGMGGEDPLAAPPGAGPGAGPGGPPMPGGPGAGPPGAGPGGYDEEARLAHGDRPVKFDYAATGFGGPMSVTIPTTGTTGTRYGRGGRPTPTAGTRGQPMQKGNDPERVRMQRQLHDQAVKLARMEAKELVGQLEAEGVVFGDTAEDHAKGRDRAVADLAAMAEPDRRYFADNVIRKHYKRRQADPANPAAPGVARYARPGDPLPGSPEDYEPASPAEAAAFADAQLSAKATGTPLTEVVKFMRTRRAALNGRA